MIADLTGEQKLLADYMSGISERCYSAQWMDCLEFVLWMAVINGPVMYGSDFITQSDIEILLSLANRSNSWIIFDEEMEEISIELDQWKLEYQKWSNAK